MKRILAMIITACLCLSFTGCKLLDYSKASKYYKEGQYAQAQELYSSLGDYADSQTMAHLSWQKADYEAAGQSYAAGDYRRAMELYYGLEMYMDSPVKAIESQYALGVTLVEQGQYGEAIELLEALGTYSDSSLNVNRAVALWLQQALVEGGNVTMTLDNATLQMEALGDSAIAITYHKESQLLGVPNTCSFTLMVYPVTQTAAYEASYLSAAASTILEEASGTVDPAVFCAGEGLSTYAFTQTITDPEGVTTVSNETTDAIILQSMLSEATGVVAENFSQILALTGTDITPQDLGFTGLN